MTTYAAIAIFLVLLLVISNFSARKITKREFTLAGRKMKTFPVLISVLATETSAASLLLFPDLGFNPSHRFIYLQLVAGMTIGRLLSAWLLVGPVYKSGKESVYDILADKLSSKIADLCVILYTVATVLAAGVRLFIGAIALSILSGGPAETNPLQVVFFIIIAGGIAIYYSRKGGLKTVIYTDNLQFLLIIAALMGVLMVNINLIGFSGLGISDFTRMSPPAGSTWYGFTYSLPLALSGGIVLSLGSHGIDQTTIQRVLAQESVKEARRSIVYSAIAIGPFIFLYLLSGFSIWSEISASAGNNPAELPAGDLTGKQYIYPGFLYFKKNTWLIALTSVAFLSAAMSSIDSALHSMATTLKDTDFKFAHKLSLETLTLLSGLALILSALCFQMVKWMNPDAMLISLALGATGMIFSPMTAMYLAIFYVPDKFNRYTKDIKDIAARVSLISGVLFNAVIFILNYSIPGLGISWLLSLVVSFLSTILIYIVVISLKTKSTQK
jgi:Na+/proline symporter